MCRLPYVEAVLLEIQRMYAVVPVAGPRTVTSDTVLGDFVIPKVCLNYIFIIEIIVKNEIFVISTEYNCAVQYILCSYGQRTLGRS